MRFIIRTTSRTADGREIVRESTIERDRLTIGRAAENGIHLPDLALDPVHAEITVTAPGWLRIASLGGLGFDCDGRNVADAAIDARTGAELGFGSYRIRVALDNEAVVLAVASAGADEDGDGGDADRFSLAGLLPGKRATAWGLAVAILVAFLAWPVWTWASYQDVARRPAGIHGDGSWSSGPLSIAHAGLEDNCQACHRQPFVSVRDDSCLACHKDTHDHADATRQIAARGERDTGGKLLRAVAAAFNKPEGRCVDCHVEHQGRTRMQPTAQRFCTDCHDGMNMRLRDTRIANAADFGQSHPQFRPTVFLPDGARRQLQRVSLDQPPREDNGLKFPHALHLSRTNGVARMAQTLGQDHGFGAALACKDCHTADPSGTRFEPVDMERDCAMCHSLGFERIGGTLRTLRHGEPRQVVADILTFYRSTPPARPINLGGMARRRPGDFAAGQTYDVWFGAARARPAAAAEAIRAVFSKGGACFDCHSVTPPVAGGFDYRIATVHQPARYFQNGWFDHAAHRTESCTSCHNAPQSREAADLLLPGIKRCRDCHGGESSRSDVPSSCAMCHDYHSDAGAPWASRERDAKKLRLDRAAVTLITRPGREGS